MVKLAPRVTSFGYVNKATGFELPDNFSAIGGYPEDDKKVCFAEIVKFVELLHFGFDQNDPENSDMLKVGINGFPLNGGAGIVIRLNCSAEIEEFQSNGGDQFSNILYMTSRDRTKYVRFPETSVFLDFSKSTPKNIRGDVSQFLDLGCGFNRNTECRSTLMVFSRNHFECAKEIISGQT